jgi:hypothetical protein
MALVSGIKVNTLEFFFVAKGDHVFQEGACITLTPGFGQGAEVVYIYAPAPVQHGGMAVSAKSNALASLFNIDQFITFINHMEHQSEVAILVQVGPEFADHLPAGKKILPGICLFYFHETKLKPNFVNGLNMEVPGCSLTFAAAENDYCRIPGSGWVE